MKKLKISVNIFIMIGFISFVITYFYNKNATQLYAIYMRSQALKIIAILTIIAFIVTIFLDQLGKRK